MDIYEGLADNFGDMGFSETEWESMFELMETNQDELFTFEQFVFGIAAYQRGINQTKIRETFHLIDVRGDGQIELNQLKTILQQEYQAGESGSSIGEDVQVWFHIIEEIEKDGER